MDVTGLRLCMYFRQGRCERGVACSFSHATPAGSPDRRPALQVSRSMLLQKALQHPVHRAGTILHFLLGCPGQICQACEMSMLSDLICRWPAHCPSSSSDRLANAAEFVQLIPLSHLFASQLNLQQSHLAELLLSGPCMLQDIFCLHCHVYAIATPAGKVSCLLLLGGFCIRPGR